jgi:hypothetical protein
MLHNSIFFSSLFSSWLKSYLPHSPYCSGEGNPPFSLHISLQSRIVPQNKYLRNFKVDCSPMVFFYTKFEIYTQILPHDVNCSPFFPHSFPRSLQEDSPGRKAILRSSLMFLFQNCDISCSLIYRDIQYRFLAIPITLFLSPDYLLCFNDFILNIIHKSLPVQHGKIIFRARHALSG